MIRKCGLFVLSFALLLTASFTVFSANVGAASVYDNAYQQTPEIFLDSDSYGGTCGRVGISSVWASYLTDHPDYASFQNALGTGSWAVSHRIHIAPYEPRSEVYVYWSESSQMDLDFYENTSLPGESYTELSVSTGFIKSAMIVQDYAGFQGTPGCNIIVMDLGSSTSVPFTNSLSHEQQGSRVGGFLAANVNINYPPDYEGFLVADSYNPTEPGNESVPVLKPDFIYQVNNKSVTATDYQFDLPEPFDADDGWTIQGYEIEWILTKCDGFDEHSNICQNPTNIKMEHLPQVEQFNYTVSEYGDYELSAQYMLKECYRYPSFPATPDECIYVYLGEALPDYDHSSTKVQLKIDGSSFTGDTKSMTCDINGNCSIQPQDCTELEPYINRLKCETEQSFGFGIINPSLMAFRDLFSSLLSPANPACNIPLQNVKVRQDLVFPLDSYGIRACSWTSLFREQFPIITIAVNGLFALITLKLIVAIINRLTDDKQNNLIEGL